MSLASTLHSLLEQSASPDASVAQVATRTLKKDHLKDPETIQALYEILASSTELNTRNLAAVELRRRILLRDGALWNKVPEQVRTQIKQNVLELAIKDVESSTPSLRTSISRVISAIAVNELDAPSASPSAWTALLPSVFSLASNPQSRLVGIAILNDLLEDAPEVLQAEFQTMLAAFGTALADSSADVRCASLTGLGRVAEYLDLEGKNDVATLESLVPGMVSVLRETMESGDKDGKARQAFDDVETIIISETSLITKHISDLVSFFLTGGENVAYEKIVRIMSLNALLWIIRCHHKSIEKLVLADSIVARLLPIGREDMADDNEEETPATLAFRVLDVLSQTLTPGQIFPFLHKHIQADMANSDPAARKSALLALGYTIEGCSEFIRPHVAQLWPIVDAGLQDGDAIVKKAACVALGCLAESLPEEVAVRHEFVVPVLFNLVSDPSTQKAASAALDSYLEVLGDTITVYLPLLMERLLVLLDSAPLPIRATITGAIGSAAHAADDGFVPYFEATVARIQPFLSLTAAGEERALRSVAMDTLGTIGEAVGKELFMPLVEGMMKSAFEALTLEGEGGKLKESAFMAFGTVAGLIGEDFVPFLSATMEALVQECEKGEMDDDAITAAGQTITTAEFPEEDDGDDDDEDDEDFEDVDEEDRLEQLLGAQAASATIAKEIAADVIGDLFASTGKAFLPYVERSTKVLVALLDHYYSGLRKSAVTSMYTFIGTFYDLSEPAEWQAGANASTPLHETVKQLVDVVLPALFARWDQEDDRSVAALFGTELAELMSRCGPAIVQGHFAKIATIASTVLKGDSLAQDTDAADEDEDDESSTSDEESDESELVSSAADLVGALATVLGADFSEEFGKFLPLLAGYYGKDRSSEDRSIAIGCLGEIIAGLKSSVGPHVSTLLPLILSALADPAPEICSNAAFAAGHLALHAPAPSLSLNDTVALLTALKPLFEVLEGADAAVGAAKDNACGAVARMLLKEEGGQLMNGMGDDGVKEVVGMLVGGLPLKNDFIENAPVLTSLLRLFQLSTAAGSPHPSLLPLLMSHIDRLLAEFAYVLEAGREEESESATREKVQGLVRELAQMDGGMRSKIEAVGLRRVLQ